MRYRWPDDTVFTQVVLSVEQAACSLCQRNLHVCDHRFHRIFSLPGPLELACMVAARHQDQVLLAEAYKDIGSLVLTIDGLQPEKGHETLYVVRELRGKRVWFAEALLSSSTDEVQRLLGKAKDWAQQLGKPVELWMSDKQDTFVTGIDRKSTRLNSSHQIISYAVF